MGVNLDDILGNKDQEILVDKTKRNVNYLMIGAAVVVVLIVIIAIVMMGRTNTNNAIERARAIARDAERISSVVKDRYAEARSTGNDTLIIGEAQEKLSPDQIRSITVNGKKLSFKYGYYYLTVDQVRQLVPTLEVGAPYIVKYSTGETICLSGVPYNGKTYYEVADLKAIAAGQTPPSDYTVVVNNAEDMKLFASYPYATFRLNADVDMSAFNNGNGWTPVPTFTGTFDGRGYKISNLRINNSSLNYAGLFGTISAEGWVNNLVLENIDVAGGDYVGAVAGSCSGTISNCTVSGRVASTGRYVGGLFGNFEGTASNVTSIVSVNGSQFVGGFAGQITGGNVTQCKVKGRSSSDIRVSGRQDCVGGFVGEVAANRDLTIDQVCAVATVTGDAKVGGLVGRINSLDSIYTITISNCYSQGVIEQCNEDAGGFVGNLSTVGRANIVLKYNYTNCKPTINCEKNRGGFAGYVSSNNTSVSFCYWQRNALTDKDLDENGVGYSKDSTVKFDALTPEQIKLQTSYTGWDPTIKNWRFTYSDAPILSWE